MAKLTMTVRPDKAAVNNSGDKAIGVELFLDQITKADPFASLFSIKPEVFTAIKADMEANGFDPSKPVNVWKKPDGTRFLIDGYTRVRAAEELGLLRVTAYEKTFTSEAEALAYAIHTQRDRRNLSDAELLRLIVVLDQPQEGFRSTIAAIEANGEKPRKTAEITAAAIGTSRAKVERARVVLSDPEEATAVRDGTKTIHQAAEAAKAKRDSISPHGSAGSKRRHRSKTTLIAEEDALSEGHRILLLLNALSASDPNESRRTSYKSASVIVRRALK
jgi:ParB-like chromosome segregation protein Spo0J